MDCSSSLAVSSTSSEQTHHLSGCPITRSHLSSGNVINISELGISSGSGQTYIIYNEQGQVVRMLNGSNNDSFLLSYPSSGTVSIQEVEASGNVAGVFSLAYEQPAAKMRASGAKRIRSSIAGNINNASTGAALALSAQLAAYLFEAIGASAAAVSLAVSLTYVGLAIAAAGSIALALTWIGDNWQSILSALASAVTTALRFSLT